MSCFFERAVRDAKALTNERIIAEAYEACDHVCKGHGCDFMPSRPGVTWREWWDILDAEARSRSAASAARKEHSIL